MIFIMIANQNRNNKAAIRRLMLKKTGTENAEMIELAKRFIGKECLVYAFDNRQFTGIIKEVNDGAILLENNGAVEAINLDFVIRIREYPKNKNGKKKSVILD